MLSFFLSKNYIYIYGSGGYDEGGYIEGVLGCGVIMWLNESFWFVVLSWFISVIEVHSGVSDLQEGNWICIVVFIQKGRCGCNAMRGIGWKYSLRPLFWQEVKEVFFQMVLVNLLVMQVCMRSRGR